jgi:hypothetical protein
MASRPRRPFRPATGPIAVTIAIAGSGDGSGTTAIATVIEPAGAGIVPDAPHNGGQMDSRSCRSIPMKLGHSWVRANV